MQNSKLEKLNEITNHAITYSWLGFIALAAYVGKRLIDFVFRSVIDSVVEKFCLMVDKKVEEKLEPIREANQKTLEQNYRILNKVSDVVHMLKNKDAGEAGAFCVILEGIEELKNEKK